MNKSKLGFVLALAMSVAVLTAGQTRAGTALAQSQQGDYYVSPMPTVKMATARVPAYCRQQGGSGGKVLWQSRPGVSGYLPLATNPLQYFVAADYGSQEQANQVAMQNCVKNNPTAEQCQVALTLLDSSPQTRDGRPFKSHPYGEPNWVGSVQPMPESLPAPNHYRRMECSPPQHLLDGQDCHYVDDIMP